LTRRIIEALVASVVTFVLCSVLYPLVVWGAGQLAFPRQAEGSLVYRRDRTVIGSSLVAQPFRSDRYFHPRPSAADYKADAASGSNLGPKNPAFRTQVADRAKALNASETRPAPVDLVTASGSGLDPHISLDAAFFQAPRVASARGQSEASVRTLVEAHVKRSGTLIGAPPRVNVLLLNLALDDQPASP
jgi:K+-transporting ATPase ATPase C chain